MEAPYILHMLSPLKHVSPFDVNMALDAGFTPPCPTRPSSSARSPD